MNPADQSTPEPFPTDDLRRHDREIAPGLILSLATADLKHEKVLNACLVLALTAVVAPLMILFGLRNGVVETLRDRLVEDPRNREIRPQSSQVFEREWLEELARRPDVAFVAPMTRQIATGVTARLVGGEASVDLDLMASGRGDAVVEENGAPAPGPGECVLSTPAAKELGAAVGSEIEIEVARFVDGTREAVTVSRRCVGVVDLRATGLAVMYAPLETLEAVERFRDGQAVPGYGWPGGVPEAHPVYDGAVLALPSRLEREDELELVVSTGFSRIRVLKPEELTPLGLTGLPEDAAVYLLTTERSVIGRAELANLAKRVAYSLRPPQPWIHPIEVELVDPETGRSLGRMATGISGPAAVEPEPGARPLPVLDIPAEAARGAAERVEVRAVHVPGGLRFPATLVRTDREASAGGLWDPHTGGVLRLARERKVKFEEQLGMFTVSRRGFASFRLYAANIDAVPGLEAHFREQGISVFTKAERIRDVKELDSYLRYIFWMIASLGILGGVAALMASLFAATERKRRPLGVLRLLGITRIQLLRFPLYQALAVVLVTMVLSFAGYSLIAGILNKYSAPLLAQGERICSLPTHYLAAGVLLPLVLAACASLAAATKVMQIEPAEALRDE